MAAKLSELERTGNALKGLWAAVHALKEKRAALCISGGGIRSATFGPVARTMMGEVVRAPRGNGATDCLYPYRNFIGMRLMFKIETSERRRLTANRFRPRMSAPCHSRSFLRSENLRAKLHDSTQRRANDAVRFALAARGKMKAFGLPLASNDAK